MTWAPSEHRLLVLYGSESGCAEDVAQRIERAARARGLCTALHCMDEFDVCSLPQQPLVVYVASTAGAGQCPANMRRFWRLLLRRALPPDSLRRQRAAVFGLGDSSYPMFNAAARRLHQRLTDLGAAPLCPRGLADDQHPHGVDAALLPFMRALFHALPCPQHGEALPPPLFRVHLERTSAAAAEAPPPPPALGSFGHGAGQYTPFDAAVLSNRRLSSPQHSQEVRHVEFDLSGSGIGFEPGDVLLLHPSNDADQVRHFVEDALGESLDTIINIEPVASSSSSSCSRLPRRTTLRDLCTRFLDIAGTPKRPFFEALAHFATDELHKERLLEFCSPEGQDELYAYNNRERRTYAEVMLQFSSAKIPLEHLVELVPRLKPRQFSIASSPLAHPNRADIVVAIVEFTTPYKRHRSGICSRFVRSLTSTSKAPIWARGGSLCLPRDLQHAPMVMVGPGTGVAPFRSMLQHLQALRRRLSGADQLPGAALFFGCRFEQRDFLYREDWYEMLADGTLELFAAAFSRDQPHKVYVQHRLAEHGAAVFDMVHRRNAVLMVAGNAKQMPADVRQALLDILQQHGAMNQDESAAYLKQMTRDNRFLLECWA